MLNNRKIVSTFNGNKISFSVFGASHAPEIGIVINGLPKGEQIDTNILGEFMARRSAKKEAFSTARIEPDKVIFESGVKGDKLTGEEITAVIKNANTKSSDYGEELIIPRPGHADYVAYKKFGKDYDFRGGGQFSGRMTATFCILGGIAKQILEKKGVKVNAYLESIGNVKGKSYKDFDIENFDFNKIDNSFPLLDDTYREKMLEEITKAKKDGDSIGGKIECVISGVPVGTGNTMFDSIESVISSLCFAVPAVKGIEFGSGFDFNKMRGSEANDSFYFENGVVKTKTNNNGGINGGIANGMPITFGVVIKPTPSIYKEQQSINLKTNENVNFSIKGRHDCCIAVRAVAVIEAMASIAILDKLL